MPLPHRHSACRRTLQELAWLFDRVQRGTAAAAAAGAAVKAVAAAGGAGGDDAPPGPPPPRPAAAAASASLSARHVWAFLGAAADLLAVRKGSMGKAKLPERGRQLVRSGGWGSGRKGRLDCTVYALAGAFHACNTLDDWRSPGITSSTAVALQTCNTSV